MLFEQDAFDVYGMAIERIELNRNAVKHTEAAGYLEAARFARDWFRYNGLSCEPKNSIEWAAHAKIGDKCGVF